MPRRLQTLNELLAQVIVRESFYSHHPIQTLCFEQFKGFGGGVPPNTETRRRSWTARCAASSRRRPDWPGVPPPSRPPPPAHGGAVGQLVVPQAHHFQNRQAAGLQKSLAARHGRFFRGGQFVRFGLGKPAPDQRQHSGVIRPHGHCGQISLRFGGQAVVARQPAGDGKKRFRQFSPAKFAAPVLQGQQRAGLDRERQLAVFDGGHGLLRHVALHLEHDAPHPRGMSQQ